MTFRDCSPGDDSLDRLIANARWADPSAEQVERLGKRWSSLVRRRRALRTCGALAAAAAILVIAGTLPWRHVAPPRPQAVASKQRAAAEQNAALPLAAPESIDGPSERPAAAPEPTMKSIPTRSQAPADSLAPRDPNLYEQVLLAGVFTQSQSADRVAEKNSQTHATIEALITALVEDPDIDLDDRLADVDLERQQWEPFLWDIISQSDASRRLGAARLLARIATVRSRGVLVDLVNDPATRDAALPAVARLSSGGELAQLASVEPDADLRRILLQSLVERRDDEAVGWYLRFVNATVSQNDALAALDHCADPPVELLLGYLNNPQRWVRRAAARSLARLPDPRIADELSGAVLEGFGRQEALLALLMSSSPQAERVLDQARQNLYLVAAVRAAEVELRSLTVPERR